MINKDIDKVFFFTFPRSGINYFAEYFEQVTGTYLKRSHTYIENKNLETFSIVRDPVDCIASSASMLLNFDSNADIKITVDKIAENYYNCYKEIINKKINNLISYSDFVNSPKKIIKNFVEHFNLEYKEIEYVQKLKNHDNYLVSSIQTEQHHNVLNYLNTCNLNKNYEQYNIALANKSFS